MISNPVDSVIKSKALAEFSRGNATASGDVSYTGVGFKPRAITFWQYVYENVNWPHVNSLGFCDVLLGQRGFYYYLTSTFMTTMAATVVRCQGALAGNSQSASVKSMDNDGFTLTWTKAGTGSGADLLILANCLR